MRKLDDFDIEQIRKELEKDSFKEYPFECIHLSEDWINWLFDNYYLHEMVENFYDSSDEDSEENRKSYLTWQEVTGKGIWDMSQKRCDKIARRTLERIKGYEEINNRFYVKNIDKAIYIFFYGRDFSFADYWMIFAKNGVDLWTENF